MSDSDSTDKKAAHAAYMREWRIKNAETLREQGKAPEVRARHAAAVARFRAANPDKVKASKAAHRAANREAIRESEARYKAANAAKIKKVRAAYAEKNADRLRQLRQEYAKANRKLLSERSSAWARKNPEARRLIHQARRARKKAAEGTLSKGIIQFLFKRQRGLCPCCKQPLGKKFHLDHITPLALGGAHSDENVQLLKDKCNLEKRSKHPVEFMQSRGFLL